jgi:hypothetical protein
MLQFDIVSHWPVKATGRYTSFRGTLTSSHPRAKLREAFTRRQIYSLVPSLCLVELDDNLGFSVSTVMSETLRGTSRHQILT